MRGVSITDTALAALAIVAVIALVHWW